MTFWEDFVSTSKSGVFWTALILSIAGVLFGIYLLYKSKDKIASALISIPFGIMAMFIIVLITKFLFAEVGEMWVDYAIVPGVSIISFSTVVWLCKKFLIDIIKRLLKLTVVT